MIGKDTYAVHRLYETKSGSTPQPNTPFCSKCIYVQNAHQTLNIYTLVCDGSVKIMILKTKILSKYFVETIEYKYYLPEWIPESANTKKQSLKL